MQTKESTAILTLQARIAKLQQSHVLLQEQWKKFQQEGECQVEEAALRMIDILDMIESTTLHRDWERGGASGNASLIINKIEKRLKHVLQHLGVYELSLPEGKIEARMIRVLETRKATGDRPTGFIAEVCRKGYYRGDKIIRSADVITWVSQDEPRRS